MTIKDVEKQVGMTSANIRYYEKEQLISPRRNKANAYREYTKEDVERLKRIKLLRTLGIAISDIRRLNENPDSLKELMNQRLVELQREKEQLAEVEHLCRHIISRKMSFDELDTGLLEERKEALRGTVNYILRADTSEQIISYKKMNGILMGLLTYAFLFCAAGCAAFGDFFEKAEGTELPLLFVLSLAVSALVMYASARLFVQLLNFQAVVCVTVLMLLCLFPGERTAHLFGVFFLLLAGYVVLVGLLATRWEAFICKCRYLLVSAVLYTIAATAVLSMAGAGSAFWIGAFAVTSLYLALSWRSAMKQVQTYNQYYAVMSAVKILNVAGLLFAAYGNANSWRRNGREFS